MLEKDFVSYDFALKLAELGYKEHSYAYYGEINGGEINLFITTQKLPISIYKGIVAPTKIQAINWLNKHISDLEIKYKE